MTKTQNPNLLFDQNFQDNAIPGPTGRAKKTQKKQTHRH